MRLRAREREGDAINKEAKGVTANPSPDQAVLRSCSSYLSSKEYMATCPRYDMQIDRSADKMLLFFNFAIFP